MRRCACSLSDHEVQLAPTTANHEILPVQGSIETDGGIGIDAHVVDVDATLFEESTGFTLGFGEPAGRQQRGPVNAGGEFLARPG